MPFVDLVGNGRLGIPDGSERAVMFTVLGELVTGLFPERTFPSLFKTFTRPSVFIS